MMKTGLKLASMFVAVATCVGIAWASGDWSGARDATEAFKKRQHDLKRLTTEEERKIVTAVCQANDEDRRSAGTTAAERVAREVISQIGETRNIRDYAYRLIDDVIADDRLKDRHNEAKQLRDDVQKRWDSIETMTERSLRGAHHPLLNFLIKAGQDAHKDYQRDCDASEVKTGSRIADCVMAKGESCLVIELKPNNSNALAAGKRQLDDQVREL